MPKTLILIQHCQSKHHVDRKAKLLPDRENGLTELGKQQAQRVAERLKDELVDQRYRLYTSPMQRAYETAAVIGQVLDVEPRKVHDIHEFNGRFAMEREGTGEEWIIDESNWSLFDWLPFPGAETWREFYARVCRGMDSIVAMQSEDVVPIVVLHGGSLSNAVVWWLGLPLDGLPERNPFSGHPGSISVLVKNQYDNPVIGKLNDTAHLP